MSILLSTALNPFGLGDLINELLRQWDAKQSGLTMGRKREALDRVLSAGAKNSELLFTRLQNLAKSWSFNEAAPEDINMVESGAEEAAEPIPTVTRSAPSAASSVVSRASELLPELRDIFVYTMDNVICTQLDDEPELATEARAIATSMRNAASVQAMQDILAAIKRFAFKLEFLSEDRKELRSGLLKLLQLMIDNVSELVVDDNWLNGQIGMVRDIVSHPLNLRSIGDAERRLKEVIFKQSQLKRSLVEAKEALKQMLAGFVDHLSEFADSTSDYHDKIERCVAKINRMTISLSSKMCWRK